MGLIKALSGSVSSTFGDQWLEYFYCDSLDKNVLCTKGQKRVNSKKSSNTKGSDNIISNGSIIAVNEGQCMMIVDQGAIVEFTAEPGEFKFDKSTEGSIFQGGLGKGIFATIARRFKFGGDTGHDQRVYYFNLKELIDNKFGTAQPVPFRVVDNNVGLDIDVNVRCNGVFSYKITNPVLFYQNVCGNVTEAYTRDKIDTQLKTEFISALQPAFGRLSEMQMRPNQIMTHIPELEKAMNEALTEKWAELRGLEIVSIALGSVTLPKEDEQLIKECKENSSFDLVSVIMDNRIKIVDDEEVMEEDENIKIVTYSKNFNDNRWYLYTENKISYVKNEQDIFNGKNALILVYRKVKI